MRLALDHVVYGRQAVVVSIDPQRVYVEKPDDAAAAAAGYTVVKAPVPNADGKQYCWYQATVKGGREARDIDAVQLAQACEELGAGELMINCINADGQGSGFELGLIQAVCRCLQAWRAYPPLPYPPP